MASRSAKPRPKRVVKPSQTSAVVRQELRHNNPTIVGLLTERLKPWMGLAVAIAAIVVAMGYFGGLWKWAGGDSFVWSREMQQQVTAIKDEVKNHISQITGKVDSTKQEVLNVAEKNKDEVKKDVSSVARQVDALVSQVSRQSIQQLEQSTRLGFVQKQSLSGQLSVVKQALNQPGRENDPVLKDRERQLEDFIRFTDKQMDEDRAELSRLKATLPR